MSALLAPLALLVERLFGYPAGLLKAIGHPVMWMGLLIGRLDRYLNIGGARRLRGALALLLLLAVTGLASGALAAACRALPWGWVIEAVLAASLLAQKELRRAVLAVADELDVSLAAGRRAVSQIVGRDPEVLDAAGVSRAAIESLAESTSDGVVAPLFWLTLGGLPGIALYKAINTADSMIGHRTTRYLEFGWASARLDDLVNLVPARLSAMLIAVAAPLAGGRARAATTTALRDAKKHDSPNAGWPEAAMAGALGLSLGGPRAYEGEVVELPRFGDGRTELGPDDIRRAVRLYGRTLDLLLGLSVVAAGAVWLVSGVHG